MHRMLHYAEIALCVRSAFRLGEKAMPALGATHPGSISIRDATGEIGSFGFGYDAVTAVSIAGLLTQLGAFLAATEAIILGQVSKTVYTIDETIVSNATPSDPAAQRENKLLVKYWDTTTQKTYTLTIPTIDFTKLVFLPGAGDAVAFTTGAGAPTEITDWVTAFEALVSPPDAPTHNVAVLEMRYVGRNS